MWRPSTTHWGSEREKNEYEERDRTADRVSKNRSEIVEGLVDKFIDLLPSNVLIENSSERFSLTDGNLELLGGRLTASIATGDCTRTPSRSADDFGVVGQVRVGKSQGHVDHAMMGKERQSC